jgi:hypothetical protein
MTTRERVLKETGATFTHEQDELTTCKSYEMETADGYSIYVVQYSTNWENPTTEEIYQYSENAKSELQEAIHNGESVYLCESLAEEMNATDEDSGYFWTEIFYYFIRPELENKARDLMEEINDAHEWEHTLSLDEYFSELEDELTEEEKEKIESLLQRLGDNYFYS